jgi:hypothetical protein
VIRIVYVEADSIYAMSAGADTARRLLVVGSRPRGPTVSPNARWLAYSSDESGRAEVYVRPFPDTKAFNRPGLGGWRCGAAMVA